MNKLNKKSAIAFVFAFFICQPLFSQEKTDTTKNHTLGEVTVIGDRIQKEVIPVQVLSGKQLEKLSVHSVADAVRYFSGVQIKDYGGIGGLKTVNIRSMGSHHVGVFYDGIELGNAQNGVVDLGRFSLDNMVPSISFEVSFTASDTLPERFFTSSATTANPLPAAPARAASTAAFSAKILV